MLPAIRIQNLGKRYQIGVRDAAYGTFREAIVRAAIAPLRRLRSRDAECGSTLGAVLDVSEDDELDRQQVARITAAIGFMAIL